MKTKIFTLFLALITSVGIMGKVKIGELYYDLNDDGTAIVTSQIPISSPSSENYDLTTVNIPSSVVYYDDTYAVTSIGDAAFADCTGLTSVTIPNSVTSIGEYAFDDCTGLTSVTIPNSVTSIGEWAFASVLNIVYSGSATGSPWGARSINGYVDGYFVYSDETKTNLLACSSAATGDITIPNSVTSIGEYAFEGCTGLTSVTIPNSVTSIGDYAFDGCSSLTSPVYNAHVFAFMPTSYSGGYTIPDGIEYIASGAFFGCEGLTSITIPNSVTSIGDEAFSGCSGLTSVVWNAKNCSDFASNNTPFYADYYKEEWGYQIQFDLRPQITSFTFGNEVEHIPAYLCNGMSNLTSIVIPNSVTSIGIEAFYECSGLTSVTIPNSVTSIGSSAFSYCTGLTSVTIGNSVTSIGQSAFWDCSGLTSVTSEAITPPSFLGDYVFAIYNIPLYVPKGSVNAYKNADQWNWFNPILPIGGGEEEEQTITTCAEAAAAALSVSADEVLYNNGKEYTVAGYVTEIATAWQSKYSTVSFWMADTKNGGRVLKAFRAVCYNESDAPHVGDYVRVTGKLSKYGTIAEFVEGCTFVIVSRGEEKEITNCAEAAEAALSVSADEVLYNNGKEYTVAGYVTAISNAWNSTYNHTSFWMADTPNGGNVLKAYRAVCNSMSDVPYVGDYVRVTGKLSKYGTIPEFVEGCTYVIVREGEREGAEETETTEVKATPTEEGSVILEWPAVDGTATYAITIFKNGELVCSLTFDAEGHLISIAFSAPARDGNGRNMPAAEQAAKGWRYEVKGLEAGAEYTYTVTAKKDDDSVLFTRTIDFTMPSSQGIDEIESGAKAQKIVRDNQILILRGSHTYDAQGKLIK